MNEKLSEKVAERLKKRSCVGVKEKYKIHNDVKCTALKKYGK